MTNYPALMRVNGKLMKARMALDVINSRLAVQSSWIIGTDGARYRHENSDRISYLLDLKDEAEKALEALVCEREALTASATREIERLPDDVTRDIMRMRYLKGMKVRRIAVMLSLSERWVYYKLEEAMIMIRKQEQQEVK